MDSEAPIEREKHFWKVNKKLQEFGTTYFSLLVFNSNNEVTYSKSSDPEWSEEFTSTGLYRECHLLNAAHELMELREDSFTLAWDLYLPKTNGAEELDEVRKCKDITHGVGFCIRNPDQSRVMLNIAGKYADINFGLNILKKREEVYKNIYGFLVKNY